MKLKSLLTAGALALVTAASASAQTVINMTGATAFRAAAHSALIQLLGGTGTTEYAYTGTQGVSGSDRAIFKGTVAGIGAVTVRTSWSGSTAGVAAVVNSTPVQLLKTTTATTTAGNNITPVAGDYETAVAKWSFSDVDQSLSSTPTPALEGGPVGVVPFMFVANPSAAGKLLNVTDQLHEALFAGGYIPLWMFTGNLADEQLVIAVGRNNGSGTRASVLSETAYGSFNTVNQYTGTATGTAGVNRVVTAMTAVGNNGYTSNSGIRDLITGTSTNVTVDGDPGYDIVILSYLTISDALVVTGYATNPAIAVTYNGVAYSEENVKNGKYTLWGYQQLYHSAGLSVAEQSFDTQLRATIPSTMGTAGIPVTLMNVTRSGGDGGPITPND